MQSFVDGKTACCSLPMLVLAPLKDCSKPVVVFNAQMMCAPLAVESGFKQESFPDKVREQQL